MDPKFVGKKYEAGLDVKEIAARMRKDIKQAIKDGEIPEGVKASVRIERFSGGSSIDIRVTYVPFMVYSEEHFEAAYQAGGLEYAPFCPRDEQFSQQMQQTLRVLNRIHASYKRDNSDIQSDYFDVNYYGQVALDPSKMPFIHDAYLSYARARELTKSQVLREVAEEKGFDLHIMPFEGVIEDDGDYTYFVSGN